MATFEEILDAAETIAYDHLEMTNWSTYHSWKHYRTISVPLTPEEAGMSPQFLFPYGSCVDISISIKNALQTYLTARNLSKDLAVILARPSSRDPGRLTHCLAAILLPDRCIVIDFSFSFAPITINDNSGYDSMMSHTLDGTVVMSRLTYIGGRLFWERILQPREPLAFVPIGDTEAIEKISVLLAHDQIPVQRPNGQTQMVPTRKSIKIFAKLDGDRSVGRLLPRGVLQREHFVVLCKIWIDFEQLSITLQGPVVDYYKKLGEDNEWERLQEQGILKTLGENSSVDNLVLDLSGNTDDYAAGIVGYIAGKLGFDGFREVVRSVERFRWLD
jgi:hypothetical protein